MPQRRRTLINIIVGSWIVLSAAGDLALDLLPFPPGAATDIAGSETQLIRILALMAWPIFLAVVGALVHGGKGALVGAAAGAGAGAVGAAATNHPLDIVMPAESLVTFHLAGPVTVAVTPVVPVHHSWIFS